MVLVFVRHSIASPSKHRCPIKKSDHIRPIPHLTPQREEESVKAPESTTRSSPLCGQRAKNPQSLLYPLLPRPPHTHTHARSSHLHGIRSNSSFNQWLFNRHHPPPRGFEARSCKNPQYCCSNGNNGSNGRVNNRGGYGARFQLSPPQGRIRLGRHQQQERPVREIEATTGSKGLQEIIKGVGDKNGGE